MILISKYFIPKGYAGIALYPFVILKESEFKSNRSLINHEYIHIKQQQELLVVLFYFFYYIEFLIRLFQYKNWNLAYRNTSFEREAYQNEKDLNFLKTRPFWNFLNYL